jgi:hypothetical protein
MEQRLDEGQARKILERQDDAARNRALQVIQGTEATSAAAQNWKSSSGTKEADGESEMSLTSGGFTHSWPSYHPDSS